MNYNVYSIPPFDKQLKRLIKKFPSLKIEYLKLIEILEKNPFTGTALINNCYKIRLAIARKGKGKAGGARVIIHIKIIDKAVYFLTIYDKSEIENISDKELEILLSNIN